MTNLERAKAYLKAIEEDRQMEGGFFADDVVQQEFPNRLVPQGATRDLAALQAAARRGQAAVSQQRYEIIRAIEQGDELAMEIIWTARLSLPIGSLPAGGIMRAHFGVFLTYREGLITSQRNYDCFDPF